MIRPTMEDLARTAGVSESIKMCGVLRVCEFLRYLGGFDLAGVAAVGCH